VEHNFKTDATRCHILTIGCTKIDPCHSSFLRIAFDIGNNSAFTDYFMYICVFFGNGNK